MKKKFQIFISSTYQDLIEERKAIQETILSMYHIPIGMEMFSADDEEQWEVIKDTIDSSDYYILIIGHCYGTLTNENISYTEKEYKYAKETNIPILAFIISNVVAVIPDKIEKDTSKQKKLNNFINDIKTGRLVEWWKNTDDLTTKIAIALTKQVAKGKRPGWIRSDVIDIEEAQRELLTLNKTIEKLRAENEDLKNQIVVRKPEINVLLNNKSRIKTTIKDIDTKLILADYHKHDIENIPSELKNLISKESIEQYNNSLPSQSELENYILNYKKYTYLKEHSIPIDILIGNIGNVKANDLNIEIIPEDGLIIYEIAEIEKLEAPIPPKKKIDPVDELYMKRHRLDSLAKISEQISFLETVSPISLSDVIKSDYNKPITSGDFIEDDILYIWDKNLLQKSSIMLNEKYCITAMNKGTFIIKARIICEEYTDYECKEIIIEVE